MDTEALFPSLAMEDILLGIWDLIIHSDLKFNNINYSEMAKYIAITCDKDTVRKHNLVSVIPRK